jgi:hypothetical protein
LGVEVNSYSNTAGIHIWGGGNRLVAAELQIRLMLSLQILELFILQRPERKVETCSNIST